MFRIPSRRRSVASVAEEEAPPSPSRPASGRRRSAASVHDVGGRRRSLASDGPPFISETSQQHQADLEGDDIIATFTMANTHKQRGPRSVWSNPDKWKQRLMLGLPQPVRTSMVDRYKDEGWAQRIAKSTLFEWSAFFMIFANAVWIGIDAEFNSEDMLINADIFFQVGENLFCTFFFLEWIVRFNAIKTMWNAFTDTWFILDTVLVLLMVVETWVMTGVLLAIGNSGGVQPGFLGVLSLLRLSRMARMARLLRASPELLIMLKGMLAAMKSVLITMGLQGGIIYIFGIALKQLASGTAAGSMYFSTVFQSMYSLAMHATLLDSPADVLEALASETYWAALVFFFVILVSSLLLLNMLIGVLCEVVSNVSAVEKEQLEVAHVREKVFAVFEESGLDVDGDGQISKHELLRVLENSSATDHLRAAGVDVIGLVDLADVIFQSDSVGREYERHLTIPDFMKLILQLRGTNTCTVKDIVDLRKFLHNGRTESNNQLERIEERLKHMERLVISQPRKRSSFRGSVAEHDGSSGSGAVKPPPEPSTDFHKPESVEPPPMPPQRLLSDTQLQQECAGLHSRERSELTEEIQSLRTMLDEKERRVLNLIPSHDSPLDLCCPHASPDEEFAWLGAMPGQGPEKHAPTSCCTAWQQGEAEPGVLKAPTGDLTEVGTGLPHSVDERLA